jgi:hypothetical protein
LASVFLGAEDHPPRDTRRKCLTGSAITLVRLARPDPRGRHARVADSSGVECQREGSDQGQRMEAGNGFDLGQAPCPVRGCPPLASHAATLVSVDRHVLGWEPRLHPMSPMNTRRPASFRLDQPSRKGSLPEWGETATRRLQSGRPEPRSRLCRDVPSPFLPAIWPSSARYVADTSLANSQHYRACEMRDNPCVLLQIVEFSRI